jgi:dTDP-4-amino-4,6-dideoxygalactose transaminase
MSEKLAILGGSKTITLNEPHYIWPRITEAVKRAILFQMERGVISIYDRSDIFAQFEDMFVEYLEHQQPFALVQNSGTTALWSMYAGAGLGQHDEVIVPSYSFYGTYSPLMWTGATPIFCDAGNDGNIDPDRIETLITSRTRAVVVTHMWGIPCDMPRISAICKQYGLFLFEDCSHAHGATIAGQKLGTFGDAAAWSLQGQKIISGGEGGIMLTRNPEIFYRALLLGQYNKRCKQQIPGDYPLYDYSLTGFGLKLRAHPLAIAMACEQFSHLDEWIAQKQLYATMFSQALSKYPFISVPKYTGQPAWYAYVFRYDADKAGVPLKLFEKALKAEGLVEIDRPNSTRPNHDLPLFTNPHLALPHIYQEKIVCPQGTFPGADTFFAQAIKLPVWAFPDEESIVSGYIDGIVKVAEAVYNDPISLRKGE